MLRRGSAATPWLRLLSQGLPCQGGPAGGHRHASGAPPLVLAIDLDETLVRTNCKGVHRRKLHKADFKVKVHSRKGVVQCEVSKRPGLDSFLAWLKESQRRGLIHSSWLFTTGSPNYTRELMKVVDPYGEVFADRMLTQEKCTPTGVPGLFCKDLGFVQQALGAKEDMVPRTLLLDNNPVSFVLCPDNALMLHDWTGADAPDAELARVQQRIEGFWSGPSQNESAGYTQLVRATPGHAEFVEDIKRLDALLKRNPEPGLAALRKKLRAVFEECNRIKNRYIKNQYVFSMFQELT